MYFFLSYLRTCWIKVGCTLYKMIYLSTLYSSCWQHLGTMPFKVLGRKLKGQFAVSLYLLCTFPFIKAASKNSFSFTVDVLLYSPIHPIVDISATYLWLMAVATVIYASLWSNIVSDDQVDLTRKVHPWINNPSQFSTFLFVLERYNQILDSLFFTFNLCV